MECRNGKLSACYTLSEAFYIIAIMLNSLGLGFCGAFFGVRWMQLFGFCSAWDLFEVAGQARNDGAVAAKDNGLQQGGQKT